MEFGIQFFPDVGPETMSGAEYFDDALRLARAAERSAFTHIRTVEHYFHPYGGYSPNPMLFLAAVAAQTRSVRLVTGAILPVFNHPLKVASEIGMLDAISGGRLEVGFARAFLPHEFQRFGVSLDESQARFDEGVDAITRLLEHEDVEHRGAFHGFPPTTTLPRPVQQPRPPVWTAALATPASFERAGRLGHDVMAIPLAGGAMHELLATYRSARRQAGHDGNGRVMLAFHMVCHGDRAEAIRIARDPLDRYLRSLVDAASDWTTSAASSDYPGYDQIIKRLEAETFESQVESGAAWVGTPDEIVDQIRAYDREVGGFEIASLQVNFNDLPVDDALRSIELFGRHVIPHFA